MHGQSVLEIIVAMAIFALISASLTSLILTSFATYTRSGEIALAENLADEALEAVRSVGDRDWYELSMDEAVVDTASNRWALAAGTGELIGDKYFRTIVFSPVYRDASHAFVPATATGAVLDPDSKRVEVRVEWGLENGASSYAWRQALVTNWNFSGWSQSDWSAGSGQAVFSGSGYDSDDGNIDPASGLALVETATSTYALSGYAVSSAFDAGGPSDFQILAFTADLSAGTGVRIRLKSADTLEDLAAASWYGPAGTGDAEDYYADPAPTRIAGLHSGHRFIAYRAELSGDGSATPVLEDMKINYKNR